MGHCGRCERKIYFWALDGTKLTCVTCGLAHEVECGKARDLTTGERTKVVLLVPMRKAEEDRVRKLTDAEQRRAARHGLGEVLLGVRLETVRVNETKEAAHMNGVLFVDL